MAKGITKYSRLIAGTDTNHNLTARFDLQDGILGITQRDPGDRKTCDRVLLSKKQVEELLQFLGGRKQRAGSAGGSPCSR